MFTPRKFRVDDQAELVAFMRHYSFATVITPGDTELSVSHVPVLVDEDNGTVRLTGHLASPNPHCQHLDGQRTTVIFHGPHSYVSPAWYTDTGEVPTWNYATVHATGTTRIFNDTDRLSALVDRMIEVYEDFYGRPWDRQLPDGYRGQQLEHITGFEMTADEITGKYKLGQNRSEADQDSMLSHLEASTSNDSQQLARFIRQVRNKS